MAEYVRGIRLPEEGKFRTWSYGGRTTTLISDDKHQKLLSGFNGDRELAETCAEIWRAKGFTGWPRGPASFFHQEFTGPRVPWSINLPLSRYFHGGWMEAFETGFHPGPLGYYDLKSAYLWAGSEPLPTDFRPYRHGHQNFLAVMDLEGAPRHVPQPFRARRALVTREDIELYDLWGQILWGVSWRDEDTTTRQADVLRSIDYLPPKAQKLMTQSYWGRWAQTQQVVATTWRDGQKHTEHQLKNPQLNLVWATLILHRVMRRVYRATLRSALLVCVDAVLRSEPLPTGTDPGDWQLKEEVGPDGVVVDAPGLWSRAPAPEERSRWDRHAGYESKARTQRKRPERILKALEDQQGFRVRSLAHWRELKERGSGPLARFAPEPVDLHQLERRETGELELAELELSSLFGPA